MEKEDKNKTRVVIFRVKPSEWVKLEHWARKEKRSVSAWLRRKIFGEEK